MHNHKADITKLPMQEVLPEHFIFSKYFIETISFLPEFSLTKWLSFLDLDTVNMLSEYTELAINDENDIEEDICLIAEDIIYLILLIIATEQDVLAETITKDVDEEMIVNISGFFSTVVVSEQLRRKGLVSFLNSGTLTNKDIEIEICSKK